MSDSVAVSGHKDGAIRFWNIRDHSLMREIKGIHDDSISSIKYLPDTNQIITNSRDNTLKIIDARMFDVVKTIESDNYYNTNDTN